ncbi:sugar phosphate isomerase/epimerase family protein [Tunturibacter empetritectus]|uniref:Sugar phosphate isomerase/epimerase n=2 Tax=Tunturiibacter TaxID=3154218 RepID=A0A852VMN8_9BACT|nr:sugar phosphate isomerase/epimerase family protein [Edaphobacter lichenicola]NYF91674.1 sugar phosphate isomerase/epimerase [Edaphobacter lichenicola]
MMQPGISTHVFLPQRLHPGLLDSLHKSGAQVIEIFAARHHFDYTDRAAVRDIATWFNSTGVGATLHQPLYISDRADAQWSRHVAPNLNLIDPEKSRRIAAMDEVKRALESAEQIPISACTLHLGYKDDAWNLRALENSLTAIEHLKAFAHPLGVRILLENLQNEITTPEHLLEILKVGHFDRVGVTLDVGHAHLSAPPDGSQPNKGIDEAFELLKPRIAELHLHDNLGQRDDHLWPGTASPGSLSIDWKNVAKHIASLPANTPGILEIAHELEETPESAITKATQAFDLLRRTTEAAANN